MPLGESNPVAQVHHPLPRGEASGDLLRIGDRSRGHVDRIGAARVDRAHVRVIGGHVLQTCEQLGDEGVHVHGQRRVRRLLLADRRRVAVRLRRGAETAEPVGRQHRRVIGQSVGEPVRRGVLRPGQLLGQPRLDEIGTPDRTDEQRAAGERGHGPTRLLQDVGGVVRRVPGCGDGGQGEAGSGVDVHRVAVGDRGPGEGDGGPGRHQVAGARDPGQLQTTGDVVVVYVGFHHVRDTHPAPGGYGQHVVDVSGRVDRHRLRRATGEVAAVAQTLQLDRVNEEHPDTPSAKLPPGVYT